MTLIIIKNTARIAAIATSLYFVAYYLPMWFGTEMLTIRPRESFGGPVLSQIEEWSGTSGKRIENYQAFLSREGFPFPKIETNYYRFETDQDVISEFIKKKKLQTSAITSPICTDFINKDKSCSWWKSASYDFKECYHGADKIFNFVLGYDRTKTTAFLFTHRPFHD